MTPEVVLVTGASRGVGAEVAVQLASSQRHVIVNYREKAKRADDVVDAIRAAGGHASAVAADVTDERAVEAMLAGIGERFGHLDVLVLNASGGLEPGADAGYAMRLNRDAQVRLARLAIPFMSMGTAHARSTEADAHARSTNIQARVIFVTSHLAHFYGRKPVPTDYVPVAESKLAGEKSLRELLPDFEAAGISFVVVSGDMIEGSIMVRLFERRDPDAVAARRKAAGHLPSAADFAGAIVRASHEPHRNGETIYVGGPDYLS